MLAALRPTCGPCRHHHSETEGQPRTQVALVMAAPVGGAPTLRGEVGDGVHVR
jgi:hypothetical protein